MLQYGEGLYKQHAHLGLYVDFLLCMIASRTPGFRCKLTCTCKSLGHVCFDPEG